MSSGGGESRTACLGKFQCHIGHIKCELVSEHFETGFRAALAGEAIELGVIFKGDDGEPSQRFGRVGRLAHVWVAGSAEWANEQPMSRVFVIKNATQTLVISSR